MGAVAAADGNAAVRIAVFDTRPLVAEGLAAILAADPAIDVLRATSRVEEVVRLVGDVAARVVVFGVAENVADSAVERCQEVVSRLVVAARGRPLGLVGVVSGDQELADRVSSDLLTVVTTSVAPDVLREMVMAAAGVDGPMPLRLVRPQALPSMPDGSAQRSMLTAREREVLHAIESGLSTREIAAELGIAVNTVRTHAQRLMSKLHVHSRLHAAALAAAEAPRASSDGRDTP